MKQEFSLKVEGKDWVSLQDAAFEKVNKDAKIDGFRPGKAPRAMYEKKYSKKYVVKGNDPKKNPVFKLTLSKLMDKFSNLPNWKTIIYNMYPRFPGGFGKADSIVLFFDKLSKDNKLDDLRVTMMKYIKG